MPQEVYSLDLEAMLSTLARRRLSGSLISDLPRGRGRKEPIHIEITIDQGKIISCLFLRGRAQLVNNNEALSAIAQLGTLPWTFEAFQVRGASNAPPPTIWIPKRIGEHSAADFYKLSHLHFLVFACIDGRKGIEEIATLLHANPEQVRTILLELEKLRFVGR